MQVKLLHCNGLDYVDSAIGMCYDKGCYIDSDKRDKRITKVALKHKHSSTIEFCNFIFEIEASTKVLLEMTRHRMANYAAKSTRYTLNKGDISFESTGNELVDRTIHSYLKQVEGFVKAGVSNEITSLMLPQAYTYKWQVQFNARSLMNFLELRRAKSAHFQIREVAEAMYQLVPDDLKYLFNGVQDDD